MPTKTSRSLFAELLGTATLVCVVIGSGIMAETLTNDGALAMYVNAFSVATALGVLIALFGPISGAHFNPVVTLVMLWRKSISARLAWLFIPAQIVGAIIGAMVAHVMFDQAAYQISTHVRNTHGMWIGEIVATAGLLFVIIQLVDTEQDKWIPIAVPAWIASAIFFTSSTSFANPAVTIGRAFSNTFAGIAPDSVPAFIIFELIGGVLAVGLARFFKNQNQTETETE